MIAFSLGFFVFNYFVKGESNLVDAIGPGLITAVLIFLVTSYKEKKSKS